MPPMPLFRFPAMAVLPFLLLASAVASVPGSCGVSKPLFKDSSIKVEPIDTHNWLQIGFSAVIGWVGHMGFPFMPPGQHATKHHDGLRCLMPYLMNCTHWQELSAGNPCPEECPFIAQVKPFACAFTCVNVTQCHYTDPNMPFANPSSQLCEESSIEGCGVQAQAGQCERCRKHFAMDGDGTRCLYDREGSIIWLVEHLHAMGYWVWVILVMMLSCCCWQFRSALSKHWHLLTFARMHYHLCKVRKNPKVHAGAPLFSICENLHTKFVIGIGLPLYYNSLVFLLILTVLLFFSTHLALDSDSQSLFNYSGVSSNMVQVLNVPIYPSAEGVSDASICSWAMEDKDQTRFNVDTTSKSFMHRLSRTALFLWLASLAIMLVHAWFQLKHARWFESQHLTMKDFALVLSGLPPHVTDEKMLAECISRQIGEDIRAVSIGYDVTSCWNEVETLLDRHLAYCDAQFCGHPDVGLRPWPQGGSRDSEMLGPLALQRNMEQDRKWVQDWFRPGSSKEIQGSGFAWAVFSSHRDRDEALHKMLALEKDRRGIHWCDADGTCHPLDFGIPRCEPTNVRWDHLGLGLCSRRCRFLGALFIWFLAAAALALFIYVPYAEYVTGFLNEAGKFPQGFMMGLLGFLIGLTWWAMCMMIGTCVNIAGFQTIEDENLFIFIFFTIFCVAASAFNVYLTWYYTQDLWQHHTSSWFESVEGSLLKTGGPVTTLRDLRKEIDLGFRVFQVLVPGVLFTPCLLSPLNNFLIPYLRESALLVLFGQGKSGREAERFLEPLPIGLAWDYQGHVTLPCCCCLTLFIMSPSMWWAQAYLCIWAFFFYLFQRFMHLRVCKKMYCTSNKLDSMVLYFGWGLLLAELAACHAYWRVRLQEWEWISILQSVIMSYAIYWTLLWALGVPWPLRLRGELDVLERSRERSDDDRCQSCEDFCYNWLNVNPVYVLKSQYCDSAMEPVIFYEPGKEYLQLAPTDETCVQNTSNQRWKMATSGLWLELEGLGCIGITPFLDSEVCGSDMVMSPADRLQEEGLLARQHGLDGQSDGLSGMDGSGSLPFAETGAGEQSEQLTLEVDDKAVEQKQADEPVIGADSEDTQLLPEQPADIEPDVGVEEKPLPGSSQAEEPENADAKDEDKADKAVEHEKAGDLPKKALLPVPSPEVSLEKEVSSRSMYSLLAQSSNATPHKPEEEVRWSAIATEESSELPGCSPEAKDSPPADTATDTATGTPDAPDVPDAPDAPDADPMPQPEASDEAKKKEPIALQV